MSLQYVNYKHGNTIQQSQTDVIQLTHEQSNVEAVKMWLYLGTFMFAKASVAV